MPSVNNVNSNSNNTINSKSVQKQDVHDNKPSKDEGIKKSAKLMLGATALAAAVVGGVVMHKSSVSKKAAKKLAEDLEHERVCIPRLFEGKVKEEEFATKIEEIGKLPPAEQLEAYKQMHRIDRNIRDLKLYQNLAQKHRINIDEIELRRGMKGVPKDVQKEMADGNWIKAGELYEAHVQELPNTFRAKNIGTTVEESISNVFGAESKVRPHTYDLTKEGEEIVSLRYRGGYYGVTATREGLLYEGNKTSLSRAVSSSDGFRDRGKYTQIGDKAMIIHGVDKEGKYVTIIDMPDVKVDTAGNPYTIRLAFISKNKKMTPAQRDLLSLAEHPEKFDSQLIYGLTQKTNANVTGAENMDYDLALSVIQSMARA